MFPELIKYKWHFVKCTDY